MKSDSDRGRSPLAGALDNASVPDIAIAGRPIGPNHPPYIIAELSANHMGDLERALKLVEVAASTGVDAVKLQTYTPDTITLDHDGPDFRIRGGLWDGRTLYDLYEERIVYYQENPPDPDWDGVFVATAK